MSLVLDIHTPLVSLVLGVHIGGLGEGEILGETEIDGLTLGLTLGLIEGEILGEMEGESDTDGLTLGEIDGTI